VTRPGRPLFGRALGLQPFGETAAGSRLKARLHAAAGLPCGLARTRHPLWHRLVRPSEAVFDPLGAALGLPESPWETLPVRYPPPPEDAP
jgi:hypothetical protein